MQQRLARHEDLAEPGSQAMGLAQRPFRHIEIAGAGARLDSRVALIVGFTEADGGGARVRAPPG